MAPNTHHLTICRLLRRNGRREDLVALPGLEPGLSALRGRRVNQLHHNARSHPQEVFFSSAPIKYSKQQPRTQGTKPAEEHTATRSTLPQTPSTSPAPAPT